MPWGVPVDKSVKRTVSGLLPETGRPTKSAVGATGVPVPNTTTSSGDNDPSRLLHRTLSVELLVMATVTIPSPAIALVTSMLCQVPATTEPAVLRATDPKAGMVFQVRPVSVQLFPAVQALPPCGLGSVTHSRRVAEETGPVIPDTSNLR